MKTGKDLVGVVAGFFLLIAVADTCRVAMDAGSWIAPLLIPTCLAVLIWSHASR